MTVLSVGDDVAWTGEGQRIVALNLVDPGASPFALEGTAAVVWAAVADAGEITLDALLSRLYDEFDADESTIRNDVERLVGDLTARGLLASRSES